MTSQESAVFENVENNLTRCDVDFPDFGAGVGDVVLAGFFSSLLVSSSFFLSEFFFLAMLML